MRQRELIISHEVREQIRALRVRASANVLTREVVAALEANPAASAERTVDLPIGYRCTFTIEEQPTATCRHLSVSVNEPGRMPSIEAVRDLMREFGFVNGIPGCHFYLEAFDPGHQAVNLVEPLSGNMAEMTKHPPPGRD